MSVYNYPLTCVHLFLQQLETLELKKSNGEVLDSDQESKLQRKDDVVLRLEQVEKLCES